MDWRPRRLRVVLRRRDVLRERLLERDLIDRRARDLVDRDLVNGAPNVKASNASDPRRSHAPFTVTTGRVADARSFGDIGMESSTACLPPAFQIRNAAIGTWTNVGLMCRVRHDRTHPCALREYPHTVSSPHTLTRITDDMVELV